MANKNAPGRAGRPSKPKAALEAMLRRRIGPDYDAVCELADLSEELRGDPASRGERIQCLKEVARYTRPQLKAIEHTGSIDSSIMVSTSATAVKAAVDAVKQSLDG